MRRILNQWQLGLFDWMEQCNQSILRKITMNDSENLQQQNENLKKELLTLQNRLKEKQVQVGIEHVNSSDYESLKGFFQLFDKDNDGKILAEEFAALHESLGEPLTLEEAKIIQHEISSGKDGTIGLAEFIKWWVSGHKGAKLSSNTNLSFKTVGSSISNTKCDFDVKKVTRESVGTLGSLDYRLCFYYDGTKGKERMSPWHDLPLYVLGEGKDAKILHMFCEIPKWTRAKFEIATRELYNPIKQDVKNGKVRYYMHGDMMFNYGAFPQTWENPNHISKDTSKPGDNDPIDAVEIGTQQIPSGGFAQVKVLGVLALIDDNETDWKVICIQTSDPLAQILDDVDDVEKHIPGAISCIREWFRMYKTATGNEPNTYGLDGKCMGKDYALKAIDETHKFWKKLRDEKKDIIHTPLPTNQRKFENFWNSYDPSTNEFKEE
jgi:inorganic pyrophosphatase